MSIWGKIIGGSAGFALGGPIGALLGLAAGHAVDRARGRSDGSGGFAGLGREAAFSIALVALSAKMAKADGRVTRDEILAFREKVNLAPEDVPRVARLWDAARETSDGFESYARQLGRLFPPASPVLEQLMALLFHIACADGVVTDEEKIYLARVAELLGFDAAGFERLAAAYGDVSASPYNVLGVSPDCSDAELRKAWVALAAENHPDKLMAQGMPEDFIKAANERLAQINTAYERIKEMRKSGA